MQIVLEDGEELTLAELERDLKNGPPRRTVAYPTPWDPKSTTPRVLATLGADGLCLWDTKTETSHRWGGASRRRVSRRWRRNCAHWR